MILFYEWDPAHYESVLSIGLAGVCFSIYWFVTINPKIKIWFFTNHQVEKAWINFVVFQKLTGVLFLGVIPLIVVLTTTDYSASELGINLKHPGQSLIYIAIMGILIVLLNFFAGKNPERLKDYPQMRIANWTTKILAINTTGWILYLLAYEILFRGVLLFLCYDSFGFWPAVAINIGLYATTHIPKGAGETFSTIPYGLLLCFITISTESILVAFATHLIMALSNDLFSIYHNAEMKVSK